MSLFGETRVDKTYVGYIIRKNSYVAIFTLLLIWSLLEFLISSSLPVYEWIPDKCVKYILNTNQSSLRLNIAISYFVSVIFFFNVVFFPEMNKKKSSMKALSAVFDVIVQQMKININYIAVKQNIKLSNAIKSEAFKGIHCFKEVKMNFTYQVYNKRNEEIPFSLSDQYELSYLIESNGLIIRKIDQILNHPVSNQLDYRVLFLLTELKENYFVKCTDKSSLQWAGFNITNDNLYRGIYDYYKTYIRISRLHRDMKIDFKQIDSGNKK